MSKSKFEQKLIEKIDQEKDPATIAKNAFRKAQSKVKSQIAVLDGKRVDLEILAEEMQEALNDATFDAEFTLAKYDAAKLAFDQVQDELADVDKTLEARKNLLESWG